MTDYSDWVGRSEVAHDIAARGPVERLAALLDRPMAGDTLPPLTHWLHCLPATPQSEIGDDGHAKRGRLIPPSDLPRRMWAGSRVRFLSPVAYGSALERTTTVSAVTPKTGRSGDMLFVTLRHDWTADGLGVIDEEQDLVYRAAATGPAPRGTGLPGTRTPTSTRTIVPDAVQLFRYSALTFNGHRIHYDRTYATRHEHYPGLVVHGPYLATLLLDHWRRANGAAAVTGYRFRAVSPLFDGEAVTLHADGDALWAARADGAVCVEAEVVRG